MRFASNLTREGKKGRKRGKKRITAAHFSRYHGNGTFKKKFKFDENSRQREADYRGDNLLLLWQGLRRLIARTHALPPLHARARTTRGILYARRCCEKSSPFCPVTGPLQPEDAATAVAASRCRDYGLRDAVAVAATSPARPLKCRHRDARRPRLADKQAVGGCFPFPFVISSIFRFPSTPLLT